MWNPYFSTTVILGIFQTSEYPFRTLRLATQPRDILHYPLVCGKTQWTRARVITFPRVLTR